MFPLLTSLVLVPLAGAAAIALIRREREALIQRVALVVSLAVFAGTLLLWSQFDASSADFQFVERHAWIPSFGIDYFVGVDGISLFLIVLTGFLTPLALLSSWESIHSRVKAFAMFVLALEAAMIGVFIALDLFLFYVFWDAMLIPMYFLIGIWGYDNRVYAAIKFMLYTMAGSVLMLVAILALGYYHGVATGLPSFDLLKLYALQIPGPLQFWGFLAFAVAFAIKVPVFPFHTWLPDAHVAGADGGLGHPGGRAAEDGHVRSRPVRVSSLPRCGPVLCAVPRGRGRDRDHLRGARRHGAARSEEARWPIRASATSGLSRWAFPP
jgi:NADH-quinone oxidoreductase subunit M